MLSAGAAAMSLVLAAHALGYGANWITEWYAYDRGVLDALGLAPHERIAGFIHIGRPPGPPEDRPRPPLNEIAVRFTGLAAQKPMSAHHPTRPRATMRRMISFVPSRIWCTRRSRTIFSMPNSDR